MHHDWALGEKAGTFHIKNPLPGKYTAWGMDFIAMWSAFVTCQSNGLKKKKKMQVSEAVG